MTAKAKILETKMDKTKKAQLESDIKRIVNDEYGTYYPGGSGGGGHPARRGRVSAGAVIKPHARTGPACVKCGRFHTVEEHALHGGSRTRATKARKAKATKATKRRLASGAKKTKTKTKKKKKKTKKTKSVRRGPAELARRTARIADQIRSAMPTVLAAVRSMPPSGRFGPGDVFISSVYDKVGKRLGMTLDQFKQWLIVQNRRQNLSLHRADMVDAMDPRKVDRSEINDLGAQFHFIRDRNAYQE
jgi:hypothetical protein